VGHSVCTIVKTGVRRLPMVQV